MKVVIKNFCILVIFALVILLFYYLFFLQIAQTQSCISCPPTCNRMECKDGDCPFILHEYCTEASCCRYENDNCVAWNYICERDYISCGCDQWICGCPNLNYPSSKCRSFLDYYCADRSSCNFRYTNDEYCGDSTETDGGDNPIIFGSVTIRYCSDGNCASYTLYDECRGICRRSELIEYYINDPLDVVESFRAYNNLFENSQYCKNGVIYQDVSQPSVTLRYGETKKIVGGNGWVNINVDETLSCNDNDESGCWKYNYRIEKII